MIELETALLDDKPHWYPLQTHDVSSIPLPRPSPYLPRRHTDTNGKKLQRKSEAGETLLFWGLPASLCVCETEGVCVITVRETVNVFLSSSKLHVCQYKCLFSPLFPLCMCGNTCIYVCVCVCVYDCLGSQRVTEPEFDEGTAVVSKGGWGMFLHITYCFPRAFFSISRRF